MIKIKFDIGDMEILNTWALSVTRRNDGFYSIVFDDGESFDNCVRFNNDLKVFQGT